MSHKLLDVSRADSSSDDDDNKEAAIQPKPMAKTPNLQKESKSSSDSHLKRPVKRDAHCSEKESKVKKAKSDNGGGEGAAEKKLPPFCRIFSEEDEIIILKGVIEFNNPETSDLLELVKKNLSGDVSKTQFMEKFRRLKDKYSKNLKKGKDECDFSNPHDEKLFKLSKKIWGDLGLANNNSSKKVMKNLTEEKKVVAGKFSDLYPFLNLSLKANDFSAFISKDGAEAMESRLVSVEKSKLDELEKEWKNQSLDEARVKLRRFALLQKQVQLLSDGCSRRD